ncbi:MAG TPA: YicC/YloC family endoribonuclease [Thermodesulfovibrionales bacterium]|jgi:uncharacterized protein (TIGR00255 family)|nr:YicC/YloC family endoribonuclease [Thermodesulfovibrionales bacterium]
MMMQSMTGFGSSERGPFKVEIRSVNHRFIDISMKIPQNLGRHEIPLRNLVKERFSRGRFDVLLAVERAGNVRVKVNQDLAREIYDALFSLKRDLSLSGTIDIDTVAEFRDLILSEEIDFDAEPLYEAFQEALGRLEEMRFREGEAIGRDMISRLDLISKMNEEVALLCPDAVEDSRKRFAERLHGLFGAVTYDENRVLQEAAIMAEKTDISEEITRFNSHLSQLKTVLSGGDSVGRKIEFLLQELNREANTIASKAGDYRISKISVEMKAELEKMREQAQNIQ